MKFKHLRRVGRAGQKLPAVAMVLLAGIASPLTAQDAAPSSGAVQPPEGAVGGMGDVNLYPKRVVLDGRQRIATVGLYNRSIAPGDYQIAIEDRIMLPDGSVVLPDKAGDPALRGRLRGAAGMLRWSPRRITLRGNEAQTVRIMARTPPELPAGEYRAHFQAVSVPPAADAADSIDRAVAQGAARTIGVTIVPRFGISIPVILRVGETTLSAGIRDIAMESGPEGKRSLSLTITRSGTRSAFGDISVTRAGSKVIVGQVKGVGVYTELDSRQVSVPLSGEASTGALSPGSRLVVTYTDDDADRGKVLASAEFVVP